MKKVLVMMTITLLFIAILVQPSKAESESGGISLGWNTISDKVYDFMNDGTEKEIKAGDLINGIANLLTTVGIVVVFAGISIVGIMYFTATPESAAKLKIKLVGLIISGIILLGAYGIWRLVGNFLINVTTPKEPEPTITPEFIIEPTNSPTITPTPTITPSKTPKDKIEGFVIHCYQTILFRNPDTEGLDSWYEKMNTGTLTAAEIIYEFVNSKEFKAKNNSNEDLIEILYQTMLGRSSDAEGKAHWIQKLNSGESIASIINGFAGSTEFQGICSEYGITAGQI